jgi:hypothetical protein
MKSRLTPRLVLAVLLVLAIGIVAGIQFNRSSSTPEATTNTAPQPADALWPFASSSTRFTSPTTAASSFAIDYMGFTKPIVGGSRQVDGGTSAVAIRASSRGSITTVLVRQLTSSRSWWVTGATSSPTQLRGRSTAYEAVVDVEIRQDGSLKPLSRATVMGGSMGVMGPFAKSITFAHPSKGGGAIVFQDLSAKDGSVVVASVVRVLFRP